MKPDRSQHPLFEVYRFSGLGCVFAGAVLLWMAGGWLLDRWIGTFPVATIVAALLGAALGTFTVFRRLQQGLHDEALMERQARENKREGMGGGP